MSESEKVVSHILVASELENQIASYESRLSPLRVVSFFREEFKIEDARAVVAEAYISESKTKYIIIASNSINVYAQNSLLKLLEEPPANIEFIIITASKSNLLPTIRSRLPIQRVRTPKEVTILDLNLSRLSYAQIFEFLKENAQLPKADAKRVIEALYHRATVVDKLMLTPRQLNAFERAYRLLELNGRVQTMLALILMSFMGGLE
ncbi:MAG: DNA polymerase III subunit delta' [Epsilonproteobacteria bacterium]|nr:DNA polymerase III subunit delta' [Campylobacterota bacterium]